MPAVIDKQRCVGCGVCDRSCPLDVIHFNAQQNKGEIRYSDECWMCGSCRQSCPVGAITLRFSLATLCSASANPYV